MCTHKYREGKAMGRKAKRILEEYGQVTKDLEEKRWLHAELLAKPDKSSYIINVTRKTNSLEDGELQKIVHERLECEEMIVNLMQDHKDTLKEALWLMKLLRDNKRGKCVLYFRYLRLLSWSEVSDKMNISVRTARRAHDKALDFLETKLSNRF